VDRALGEPTHGGWVGEWVFVTRLAPDYEPSRLPRSGPVTPLRILVRIAVSVKPISDYYAWDAFNLRPLHNHRVRSSVPQKLGGWSSRRRSCRQRISTARNMDLDGPAGLSVGRVIFGHSRDATTLLALRSYLERLAKMTRQFNSVLAATLIAPSGPQTWLRRTA